MLIVRGVNVFPTQIEEILLANVRLTAHYVLELRRDDRLDELTVVSEMKPGLLTGEAEARRGGGGGSSNQGSGRRDRDGATGQSG